MRRFTLGICVVVLSLSLGWSPVARADAVTDWNASAAKAVLAAPCIGFHESLLYAMMHLAMHDALNAIKRRFQPYGLDIEGPSGASVRRV